MTGAPKVGVVWELIPLKRTWPSVLCVFVGLVPGPVSRTIGPLEGWLGLSVTASVVAYAR